MEDHNPFHINELSFWGRHRFLILIGLSLVISCIMVWISMEMYAGSGAAQLDLSRPGYQAVRSQANSGDDSFKTYSSSGPIDQSSIDEFKSLFDEQATRIKVTDAFSGDPLSPDALSLSAPRE